MLIPEQEAGGRVVQFAQNEKLSKEEIEVQLRNDCYHAWTKT